MLIFSFAALALCLAEADIITAPGPGNSQSGEPAVQIKDEGLSGLRHSPYPVKKVEGSFLKKDKSDIKATIKDEGTSGLLSKKPTGNGVPALKHLPFEIISSKGHHPGKGGGLDFDDDFGPLNKKKLIPAGSAQASRVNVKKGPNGQDYEYEYVYYYYDEDEDPEGDKADVPATTISPSSRARYNEAEKPAAGARRQDSRGKQDIQDARVNQDGDVRSKDEEPRSRQDAQVQETRGRQDAIATESRGRQDALVPETRGRQDAYVPESRGRQDAAIPESRGRQDAYLPESRGRQEIPESRGRQEIPETRAPERSRHRDNDEDYRSEGRHRGQETAGRRRGEARDDDERSVNRYTNIERGRGRGDAIATTIEPASNEVLPSRGQRTRGRQMEAVEDERLPANTRFPSRGRNSQNVQTTLPPQTEVPSRTRNSGGANIRRPSLVDSSSFRTHSSDVAPDSDAGKYYTRENTRESDYEEYIDDVKPTTFVPPLASTIKYQPLPPVPEQPQNDGMPDKAAIDLYAILQQTQEENYVSPGENNEEVGTTEDIVPTTTFITTTTTTTTTTTEPPTTTTPTTTTTTTTTTTAPPALPGRGRYRGANGARVRPRPGGYSSTTPAAQEVTEEAPKKNKFQPSHTRNPGQTSSYGRRGAAQRKTTTAAPSEEPSTTARARASFGNNRYRARGRPGAAAAQPAAQPAAPTNQEEQEKPTETSTAAPTSAPARPTRPRLNISGARPLRPGPRINLRGKATTAAPAAPAVPQEEQPAQTQPPHVEEQPAETTSAAPPAPQDALSRLRNRPRLRVGGPRPHLPVASTEAPAPAPAPASAPEAAPEDEPAEESAPVTTEPPKHQSPLLRRRPNIRRLSIPHSQS